jgi:mono/diheme cytochrome c family protein
VRRFVPIRSSLTKTAVARAVRATTAGICLMLATVSAGVACAATDAQGAASNERGSAPNVQGAASNAAAANVQGAASIAAASNVQGAASDAAATNAQDAPPGGDLRLPQGPNVNIVYAKCRTCHDLQYVIDAKGLMPNQWKSVLASMRDYGLSISAEDEAKVLAYLTTYLGSSPPPAVGASPASSGAPANATMVDGRQVFAENCASCHGAEGRGQPGYYPPLAQNPDVGKDPLLPVLVVLHGLAGPVEVEGQHYDGAMPPFDHLSDVQVAAVVNHVRQAWGNQATPEVTADQVGEQRKRSMSAAEVHAYRAKLH